MVDPLIQLKMALVKIVAVPPVEPLTLVFGQSLLKALLHSYLLWKFERYAPTGLFPPIAALPVDSGEELVVVDLHSLTAIQDAMTVEDAKLASIVDAFGPI